MKLNLIILIIFLFSQLVRADVTQEELRSGIEANRFKVREFQILAEKADELGLRLFLFGGSAAAFAHYVLGDLKLQKGEISVSSSRFDYTLFHILRSYQDIDFVVTRKDGRPENTEEIEEIKKFAVETFPDHFAGMSGNVWDFRGLKTRHKDLPHLDPLLGPDFQNQINNTLSTGLIELTDPVNEESVLRNILAWNEGTELLTEAFISGKVRLQWSDKHHTVHNYKKGRSPYLTVVTRLIGKASQYGLDIDPTDEEKIRELILKETHEDIVQDSIFYSFAKNVAKIIKGSLDFEHAFMLLERYGLKDKLIKIAKLAKDRDLENLLNKQPLPHNLETAKKLFSWVKRPTGKTAGDLGINIATHATSSWDVIESVTWNYSLKPNLLASRPDVDGEMAVHGGGLYSIADENPVNFYGAYHFQMEVDPRAEEGLDFKVIPNPADTDGSPWVLWSNTRYLKIIPSSLKIAPDQVIPQIFALLQKAREQTNPSGWGGKPDQGQIDRLEGFALSQWDDTMENQYITYADKFVDEHFGEGDYDEQSLNLFKKNYDMPNPFELSFSAPRQRYFAKIHRERPRDMINWVYICLIHDAHGFCNHLESYLYENKVEDLNEKLISLGKQLLEKDNLRIWRVIDHPEILRQLPDVHEALIKESMKKDKIEVIKVLMHRREDHYSAQLDEMIGSSLTEEEKSSVVDLYLEDFTEGHGYVNSFKFLRPLVHRAVDQFIEKDKKAGLDLLKSIVTAEYWRNDRDPKNFIDVLSRSLWDKLDEQEKRELYEFFDSHIKFAHYYEVEAFKSPLIHKFPDLVEKTLEYFFSRSYQWSLFKLQAKEWWKSVKTGSSLRYTSDAVTVAQFLFSSQEINKLPRLRYWIKRIFDSCRKELILPLKEYFSHKDSKEHLDLLKEYLLSRKATYIQQHVLTDVGQNIMKKNWIYETDFPEFLMGQILDFNEAVPATQTLKSGYRYLRAYPEYVVSLIKLDLAPHNRTDLQKSIKGFIKRYPYEQSEFDHAVVSALHIQDPRVRETYLQTKFSEIEFLQEEHLPSCSEVLVHW